MTRPCFLPLLLGLVLAALVVAGPAPAGKSKSCAKAVVADWYGVGRVDSRRSQARHDGGFSDPA